MGFYARILVQDSSESLCCILEQDTFSALSTGSAQANRKTSYNDLKKFDWGVKHLKKENIA